MDDAKNVAVMSCNARFLRLIDEKTAILPKNVMDVRFRGHDNGRWGYLSLIIFRYSHLEKPPLSS